jgi:hypothetical protein
MGAIGGIAVVFSKRTTAVGIAGVLVGALAVLGIRFVTYQPEHVHYHANFAVYINGRREEFKSPLYYQEIAGGSCTADKLMTPVERTHMHDNVNDVVHVHDNAVTWGNFFENIRWAVTDTVIKTPQNVYVVDNTNRINFLINGHAVQDISTEIIHDRDRLLVDFGGTTDSTLQKEMNSVAKTAVKYDTGHDPAACNADTAPTFKERLQHLL